MPTTTAPSSLSVTTTDGLQLSATVHGAEAGPTVLLVHGFPDTARVWDEVAERLLHRGRVVTYDVRGAGASDVPASTDGYRFAQLADDLVAVADAVSPDAPVHVVGHDWGAIQAFEAVCTPRHAARIASFTCVSGASFDHAGRRLRAQLRPSLTPWRGVADVARQLTKSWYIALFQIPVVPERLLRGRLGRRGLDALEPLPPRDGHPAATFPDDAANGVNLYRANVGRVVRPRRDQVLVPIQVVVGDRDPFVSVALFDDLAERAPSGAWLRVVDGAHWLPRTHPDAVATAITDLVAHVGEQAGVSSPAFHDARLDPSTPRG